MICNALKRETIQHELKCATIGFMFITIIRHIKSLQKSKCIIHQLNGYYNSLFNANNLTTYRRKVAVHPIKFCLGPLLKSESLVPTHSD